ncbi:endo-1,4-beta-xylanase B-like [Corticium candelabrum]|uniref:endo-1,4-beta-xylanase B-like n=1 Tax=Corticium candelabrum TaxID=121492 RepID=UPI002E34EBAD|nr:endo-1,4-beta-xylanase B-like [Corticium candelabrum]
MIANARQETLGYLLILAATSCFGDYPRLRELAQKRNIFVGSAANAGRISSDTDHEYDKVLKEQFSIVTPENACKWQPTEPQQGKFDFKECDLIYNTTRQYNQSFRGHNLCWGAYNPSWLANLAGNRSALEAALQNHIVTVAGRYRGKAYAWDVVNEAVSDHPNGSDYLKHNIWYPTVSNYIDLSFQNARKADPQAKLFYNDYAAEGLNSKSNAIYNMIKSMLSRGIPIDGIGLQAHLSISGSKESLGESKVSAPPSYEDMAENVKRFADLGLEVHFTEMDVNMKGATGSDSEKLEKQAQVYKSVLEACLSSSKCKNYEVWGFTDKYTWLGPENKPDLFDTNYQPKPCFKGVVTALEERRHVTGLN